MRHIFYHLEVAPFIGLGLLVSFCYFSFLLIVHEAIPSGAAFACNGQVSCGSQQTSLIKKINVGETLNDKRLGF